MPPGKAVRYICKGHRDEETGFLNYLVWVDGFEWQILMPPGKAVRYADDLGLESISPMQARGLGLI